MSGWRGSLVAGEVAQWLERWLSDWRGGSVADLATGGTSGFYPLPAHTRLPQGGTSPPYRKQLSGDPPQAARDPLG